MRILLHDTHKNRLVDDLCYISNICGNSRVKMKERFALVCLGLSLYGQGRLLAELASALVFSSAVAGSIPASGMGVFSGSESTLNCRSRSN